MASRSTTLNSNPLLVNSSAARAVRGRHHWIFSGGIIGRPHHANGALVAVQTEAGEHLGFAYFNGRCSLRARMVSFDHTPPLVALRRRIAESVALRRRLVPPQVTGYRLINAEGDGLPGLVVDHYAGVLVMAISTLGMERLGEQLVWMLLEEARPTALLERSSGGARHQEGLPDVTQWRYGTAQQSVDIQEGPLTLRVDLTGGQKTGLFLDQQVMRAVVGQMARGRRVLDCFCYSGGFSVAALRAGASEAHLVDSSGAALELAQTNIELNGVSAMARLVRANVGTFLRETSERYDLIVLDPPAFAKHRADVTAACRAYQDINRLALVRLRAGGQLVTCSCSGHVDRELFQKVVFAAAGQAGRRVRIIGRHQQAAHHPVNLFHPETDYLKGLVLDVL